MKTICIGEIVAAHGIKGQVKIKTFTSEPAAIARYGMVKDAKGKEFVLSNVRSTSEFSAVAFIQGVTDRNTAETLRGTSLYIDCSQLPQAEADEFYHEDLLNLVIQDEAGTIFGKVTSIQNFGAGNFFEIDGVDGRSMTLPFNETSVFLVDTDAGKIVINPDFLLF